MTSLRPGPFAGVRANRPFVLVLWSMVGLAGWLGLASLAVQLLAASPPRAGFDLELLLVAGRRVAAGLGPYDPTVAAGSIQAEALFYSYPPPIAQLLSVAAAVPSGVVLALWCAGAVAGLAAVTVLLARRFGGATLDHGATPDGGTLRYLDAVVPVLALAPFIYPFAVSLLFGNVDAWFPFLYGAVLVGTIGVSTTGIGTSGAPRRLGPISAGIAVATVTAVKLHPASLVAWFVIRGVVARRGSGVPEDPASAPPQRVLPRSWLTVGATAATGLLIGIVSLALGGIEPWRDWLTLVRAGASADLVTWLNIGPAAQVALASGSGEAVARLLAVPVALAAVAFTGIVAWRLADPVESLAWATVASLVTLPVTWFHYPVALLPFAVAAWVRSRGSARSGQVATLLLLAIVGSGLAILLPVTVWVAVALVLVAVHRSAGRPSTVE